MNLNDTQKQTVAAWIKEGLKISDIQKRLETEFALRLTYMETRFLLDDLKMTPHDPVAPAAPIEIGKGSPAEAPAPAAPLNPADVAPTPTSPLGGSVSVTVDRIAKPGTMISGGVTFSDGQSGTWYLDEAGRLGLGMKQKGYRPSPADVEAFQRQLQAELAKAGMF